jgi:Uma2 family endonuclease
LTLGGHETTLVDMNPPELNTRRWRRVEYARLIDAGILREDDPVELLDGQLAVREPQHTPHVAATQLVSRALRTAFGSAWDVRVQMPVALDDESEPEPDVAVVAGSPRDYLDDHPARPALVVEVAHSSLAVDRNVKGALYARAGVADYWIVNLVDRVLEVYREPVASSSAPYGWVYSSIRRLGPDEIVSPLAAPLARIVVADLLP